jgi:hypothetical protein
MGLPGILRRTPGETERGDYTLVHQQEEPKPVKQSARGT